MRSAISTPHPLAQERQRASKRGTLGKLRSVPSHASNRDGNSNGLSPAQAIQTMEVEPLARPDQSNGLTPAKAIQKNDAPLARRTAIQMNEHESKPRLVAFSRIEALRVEIRKAVEAVSLAVDVARLDLVRDDPDNYSRH